MSYVTRLHFYFNIVNPCNNLLPWTTLVACCFMGQQSHKWTMHQWVHGTAAGLQRIATTRVQISPRHHESHLEVDFFHINTPHIHWGSFYNYICSTVHIILHWSLLHILSPCRRAVIMEITQTFVILSSEDMPVVLLALCVQLPTSSHPAVEFGTHDFVHEFLRMSWVLAGSVYSSPCMNSFCYYYSMLLLYFCHAKSLVELLLLWCYHHIVAPAIIIFIVQLLSFFFPSKWSKIQHTDRYGG